MSRFIYNGLSQMHKATIRLIKHCQNFSNGPQTIIGGGLGKPQGGLKEEKFFYTQNFDLMTKIREQGSKLKCENCEEDWKEYEKVLHASIEPTALRETCSLNKYQNCLEEAFFLNEQNECCKKFIKGKLQNDSKFHNDI